MFEVFRSHPKMLVVGTLSSIATFVLFYLMTVFALSWGTTALHYSRDTFLVMQLAAMIFFAITIPLSAKLAENGRRRTLIWVTVAIAVYGLGDGAAAAIGNCAARLSRSFSVCR